MACDGIRRFPTVSDGIRRYPTVSDGIRRFPTVSDGIQRYLTVSDSCTKLSVFFDEIESDGIRRYPTVFDGIRRYPTVPWFSPRRYPTVDDSPPAGIPTAGFLSTGIRAACLHSPERLGTCYLCQPACLAKTAWPRRLTCYLCQPPATYGVAEHTAPSLDSKSTQAYSMLWIYQLESILHGR